MTAHLKKKKCFLNLKNWQQDGILNWPKSDEFEGGGGGDKEKL